MKALWKGREAALRFYSSYDAYCRAAIKFAAAFLTFTAVNAAFGYAVPMSGLLILIAAAFCSFLSSNVLIVLGAVFLERQFWGVSPEAALAGAVVILIWLLLYFSFLPGKGYAVAAAAVMLGVKLPFAVPVVCGLLMGPGAAAGILMGTAAYYLASDLGQKGQVSQEWGAEMLERLLERFHTLLLNQEMLVMIVVLLAVFFVVYLIRRIPVSYSWQIGILSGVLVYGLLLGMNRLLTGGEASLFDAAADLFLGILSSLAVCFFRFYPDYRRVQRLQFEDDDYYYYVKAVPKLKYEEDAPRPDEEEAPDRKERLNGENLPDMEVWTDEEWPAGEALPGQAGAFGKGRMSRKGEERE
ncbi:MAG: hypothetical protein Q4E91_07750 [Lachnospiraceae bacterium]|nr:hypothetical protein [Lachnospiraceae bacterium]